MPPLRLYSRNLREPTKNYQSSYAIHCASPGIDEKGTISSSSMYLKIKKIIHSILTCIQQLILKNPTRSAAEAFKIYTSLDSQLQDQLQAQIDQSLSGFTELQDNGKFALQAPVLL